MTFAGVMTPAREVTFASEVKSNILTLWLDGRALLWYPPSTLPALSYHCLWALLCFRDLLFQSYEALVQETVWFVSSYCSYSWYAVVVVNIRIQFHQQWLYNNIMVESHEPSVSWYDLSGQRLNTKRKQLSRLLVKACELSFNFCPYHMTWLKRHPGTPPFNLWWFQ